MKDCCKEAADARAEEIAKRCEARINDPQQGGHKERLACAGVLRDIAAIARSTIAKPEPVRMEDLKQGSLEPEPPTVDFSESKPWQQPQRSSHPHPHWDAAQIDEAAIRADERETLLAWLSELGFQEASNRVRDLPRNKPKTREDALEQALREIAGLGDDLTSEPLLRIAAASAFARRALDWKSP